MNRKTRLLYISSINVRWLHLEWVSEELDREAFDLSFLLLSLLDSPPSLEPFLAERGIPFRRIDCKLNTRSVLGAVREVYRHCRQERIEIVHTHIFFASLVGLLGAFLARVPVRINTRHHASMNHGKPFMWLDRLSNLLATHVVATCRMLARVLAREGLPERKLRLLPLGINLHQFYDVVEADVRELALKYNPAGAAPVVGVIARFIEIKGIQYIIPAFKRLLADYPSAFLVLAYATGTYRGTIEELLAEIPSDRYVQIPFERNVFALYRLFDIFVHAPIGEEEESFGLTYVEALSAGVPSIFSPAGIASELLVHGRNAWVVEHRNSDQIHEGMVRLLGDRELRESFVREGRASVDPVYSHLRMVRGLEEMYREIHQSAPAAGPRGR
jgi:glycosyltransferase involved in cell wall biosynthesis